MPFGRSRSLRAKRSSILRPSKERMAPAPQRSVYIPLAGQPQGELSVLGTSMTFPDGPPDSTQTPKPAISCDDLHLVRSNPELNSEGPDAALGRLERSKITDDAGYAASFGQAAVQPFATEQLTSPQNLETPIQINGDGGDEKELLIGMALGDPEQDSALATNRRDTEHKFVSDLPERSTMTTTEPPSTVAYKVSEDRDVSTMPTTREEFTFTSNPLHTEERSITSTTPMPCADTQKEVPELDDVTKPFQRKPSRWNMLGGWFGRKSVPSTSATTQIDQMPDHSMPTSHHKENVFIGTKSLGVVPKGKDRNNRSRSSSTRLTKTKGGTKSTFRRTRTTSSPHPPEREESNADITTPNCRLDGQPMLSVDIPDIQLDRYSVMFGGLLQPTPPPSSQSSLLVRRHAHLENVKMDFQDRESTQGALPKSTRRATSPSYVKSPSLFSLFPSTPTQPSRTQPASNAAFKPKPSPLHRSNTTPGALSPIGQIFETAEPTDRSPVFVRKHSQAQVGSSYPTEVPIRDDAPQQSPASRNDPWNQPSENEDLPFFTPPNSPPHLTPSLSTHPNTPTPTPDAIYTDPNPSPAANATATTTNHTTTNPTISIARQISITRRQRQFHVPFDPNDSERLVDRRPMTPTLVNVRSRSSSASGAESRAGQGNGRGHYHANSTGSEHVVRKSQRIVIECVEG